MGDEFARTRAVRDQDWLVRISDRLAATSAVNVSPRAPSAP